MSDDYDWSRHLVEGEELLWQGRPDGHFRLFLRDADFFLVPFSGLFFLAFSTAALAGRQAGVVALLFGYVLFIRPLIDQANRRNLRYAVTNMRILRAHQRLGILNRIEITQELKMDVILGRYMTIRFGQALQHGIGSGSFVDPFGINYVLFEAMFRGYVEPGPEFRRILDGKEVSRLLKSLRATAKEKTA